MLTATQTISGTVKNQLTCPVSIPVYQTGNTGYETRRINIGRKQKQVNKPASAALKTMIEELEDGKLGIAFGSGVARIHAVLKLLKFGDEIIVVDDNGGADHRLHTAAYKKSGIKVHYADALETESILKTITPHTKLIWLETVAPTLKVSNVQAIAKVAKASGWNFSWITLLQHHPYNNLFYWELIL